MFSLAINNKRNRIGDVMVSMPAVVPAFETRLDQSKDYKIGICCFFDKRLHASLSSTNKDWWARNRGNMSEWSDMSTY